MKFRRTDAAKVAAAKASFSPATAYRFENDGRLPSNKLPVRERRRPPLPAARPSQAIPVEAIRCPQFYFAPVSLMICSSEPGKSYSYTIRPSDNLHCLTRGLSLEKVIGARFPTVI